MSGSSSLSYGGTTVAEADHVDWISTLPDSILYSILSLLPTKQAVATSVLSKRWQSLWRSVPTLDFEDWIYYYKSKEDYDSLVQSVSALILHLHHPIHKFRIRCWPPHFYSSLSPHPDRFSPFTDPANVTIWVDAAVQRGGVQHLHLHLSSHLLFSKPPVNLSATFSCKTLVVLKLEHIRLEPISSVDLPLLKVMHLHNVIFSEHGCLAELLSGCPLLEDFRENEISFQSDYENGGGDVTHTDFETLPALLRADISAFNTRILLEVVNKVKFLHIQMEASIVGGTGPYIFPMFPNLSHIHLDYSYSIDDWSEVVELIKNCPKLQVLVIDQPETANWQYPPSILHLKRCTKDDEIQFARYITEDSKEDDNMQDDHMQWHYYKYSTSSQLYYWDEGSSFYFSPLLLLTSS